MQGSGMEGSYGFPKWLPKFLEQEYFSECNEHIHTNAKSRAEQSTKKGDRNFFCVECSKGPLCDAGRQLEHCGHHVLQVRKASHTDAIRINDITKLIDISHIQTYTINGAKIVFLPSRPQAKPAKGAPRYCDMCHRSLQDQVRFCSLSCKLKGILENPSDASLTLIVPSGGAQMQKGSNGYHNGESTTFSGSDEAGNCDLHDLLLDPSSPATPAKKRIRSSNKGMSMLHDLDRPMKLAKLSRQQVGVDHLLPHSPTSVLHHSGQMLEAASPVSAGLDSSSSQEFVETMSFRKRSRKGVPYRAPGVGIEPSYLAQLLRNSETC